jgi:hypothetical protein
MATKSVFLVPVGLNILFEVLDEISLFRNNQYMIDPTSFNKMMYMGLYTPFVEELKKHYSPKKSEILFKEPSYHNFIIIVKHICKYHNLKVTPKVRSANCSKHVVYFITFDRDVSLVEGGASADSSIL